MPQGSVIGNPCLQNELMGRWENRKGNRWAKRAPRLEGVADEVNGTPLEPLPALAISYSSAFDLISKQQRGRCARSQHS
jgi:hypothetical protein